MARANRNARVAARFGMPDLIADRVAIDGIPNLYHGSREKEAPYAAVARLARARVADAVVVEATNIAHYLFRSSDKEVWEYTRDFHCVKPPLPLMFIEWATPSEINSGGVVRPSPRLISRVGWLIAEVDRESEPAMFERSPPETASLVSGQCFWLHSGSGGVTIPVAFAVPLDSSGRMLTKPVFYCLDGELAESFQASAGYFAHPMFLALSFMHCKNVAVTPKEVARDVAKRRRKAGLPSFVRYNVVDIEPMKAVLRADGGSDTDGVRRAMHICRGHFATYTEAKPLFGRVSGTFWVPAHVRGDRDSGVVASDYRVKGPKGDE